MYKAFTVSEAFASSKTTDNWLLNDAIEDTVFDQLGGLYRLPEQALVIDDDLTNSPILF